MDATDGWREWQKRNNKDVSVTSGYYSIDPESHLVVIQFTEDYCTYIREKNGIFEGTLNFEGQVKRADTIDGDQTIIANGHEIHVAFDDAPATIDKSCSIDTGAKVIRWTVVLKNPGSTKDGQFTGYTDLTKCTLEDLELPDNVQTNPDGMGSVSNHQFTFSEAANHQETITFTYERALTEAELSSGSVTNTATLKDENQQTISQDTENAKFATSKSILSKSGTPSYAVDGSKGFILWTIQVDRGYGMSLKDYVLADDAWKGEYSDLTAVDRNGQTVALTIDKTTGMATVNGETDSVTITYKTPQTANGTVSNEATVTPPGGQTPDDEETTNVTYDTSSLFDVKKSSAGYDDISATWKVTLNAAQNGNKGTLDGYALSDEAFQRMIGDFNIQTAKTDGQYGSNTASVTFTKNADGTYTIHGDANYLEFTYRAKLSEQESHNRLQYNWTEVKNEVTVTPPGGGTDDQKKSEGKQGVPGLTNGVTKVLKSNSHETDTGYHDPTKEETKTLSWEVTMDQYAGFSDGSKAYVDVMSATNGGDHYIIPKDANIVVTAAGVDGQYNKTLVAGTDYTITFYTDQNHTTPVSSDTDRARSYVITFQNVVDQAPYTHVKVAYDTTADVTGVNADTSSIFSNEASFNGTTSGGNSFTFERETPKATISVKKNWVHDDADARPDYVTIQLYRKTGADGEWELYGLPETLRKEDGYAKTWSDLPQRTEDSSETPYYYRAVEINPDENYTVSYDSNYENGLHDSGTLTISNTWKMIKVSVNKKWVGDSKEDRPSSIQVKLQQRLEGSTEWTDVADQETKTMQKNEDGTFTAASWTNLPQTTSDGKKIYYRAIEPEGQEGLQDYTPTYDENGIQETGASTITNTWECINLTVQKDWVGDEPANRPASVAVKLQQKTADGTWTDVDTAKYPHQTLTNDGNGTFSTATWAKLPKKDANGNALSYRAVEVTVPENYEVTNSEQGLQSSGIYTITNLYQFITISAHKEWSGDSGKESKRPDSITFQLQRKTGTDGTWEDVADSAKATTKNGGFADVSWADLPRRDADGNLYYYRVTESPVPDGYTASEWDETGSNASKTFTITNTLKPALSKSPIRWMELGTGGQAIPNVKKVTSISTEDLADWKTTTVSIDGTETECYVFQWWLELEAGKSYQFDDILPEHSVLISMDSSGGKIWAHYTFNQAWYIDNNRYYTYDTATNKIHYDQGSNITNIDRLSYYTAIPKTIVDEAIQKTGSYQVTNQIKTPTESDYQKSTLTIEKGTDPEKGLLSKGYVSGYSDRQLAQAKYSLIVNPDGKNLSNESTLDLSDVFQILGYQPKGGTRVDGSNLADVNLADLTIQEIDANGNIIRTLSENEYSYLLNTEENSEQTETEFTLNDGQVRLNNTNFYIFYGQWKTFQKGLKIVAEVSGTPGQPVNARISEWETAIKSDSVLVTSKDAVYDADGKATITVEFLKDVSADFSIQTDHGVYQAISIVSATVTNVVTTTQTILRLSVPDETPLRITYNYELTSNQNTKAVDASIVDYDASKANVPGHAPMIGERLPAGSTIYLKNTAKLTTSSGDVTDKVGETGLTVEQTGATSQTAKYPTIQKVDVGDYSLSGLHAVFKLAKFDTTSGTWIYATKLETDGTNSALHLVTYGSDSEVERDNKKYIPESAADLVVDGKFNIKNLEEGTLYKLVETTAPEGYQSTGWKSATETALDEMKGYTYYFVYNGTIPQGNAALDAELSDQTVKMLAVNGTLQIPNSRLIDIGAEKIWSPVPTDAAASVDLELWWSTSKSLENAKKATAEDLGVDALNPNYTLARSTDADGNAVWRECEYLDQPSERKKMENRFTIL